MPRSIEVSAPPALVDAILERIDAMEGIVSLARQRSASLAPPGDVLSIQVTTDTSHQVLAVLKDLRVVETGSVVTSDVMSVLSSPHQALLDRESDEAAWDEMAFLLRGDANPSPNYLTAMFLAGAIAAGGLWLDMLHIVIGAMVIAPAFEPLVRLPFGLLTGPRELIPSGFVSITAGFFLLALGGAVTALVFSAWDPGPSTPLAEQEWVSFWSTLTLSSVVISVFGSTAGAVVISGRRSVLTTGVMITLALIPSMTLVGMGVVVGDFLLAGQGLLRWSVDVVLVMGMSAVVFALKRRFLHGGRNAIG